MKTGMRALSLLLIVALIGAMFVPVVSASGNSEDHIPVEQLINDIPELTFDRNMDQTKITGELSVSNEKKDDSIPEGSIIYHSKKGVTTIFNSKGEQVLVTNDADAEKVSTPSGLAPATFVQEIPSGSYISTEGTTIFVQMDGELILTILTESPEEKSAKSVAWPSQYIEGSEETVNSLGQYYAKWNVPQSPQMVYSTSTDRSQIAIWNGVQTTDGTKLIQPVLEWFWKDRHSDPEPGNVWTGSSWYVYTGSHLHSTRLSGIQPGDVIEGDLLYNHYNDYWTITFRDVTRNIQTTYVAESMPNSDVDIEAMLEGYTIPDNRYICGDTTFSDFYVVDTSGHDISPGTVTSSVNSAYWSHLSGLWVGDSWPVSITLNTAN